MFTADRGAALTGSGACTDDPKIVEYRVREALAAHARGWVLTPLTGKIPSTKRWQVAAVPTEDQVEQWATAGNLGLRTGQISGVCAIDEDTAKGGRIDGLPLTVTQITGGGGKHFLFRHPPGHKIGNSAGRLAPHVDVRGDGGQIVFAGSVHPATGRVYRWATTLSPDDLPPADLPPEILARLVRPRGYGEAALAAELDRVRRAPEGERNTALNRAAFALGQLVAGGVLDGLRVVAELEGAALGTGLALDEIRRTIASGLEAGKREPRAAPVLRADAPVVLIPGAHVTDTGEYVEIGAHTFAAKTLDGIPVGKLYRRANVPGEIWHGGFHALAPDRARAVVDENVRLGKWVKRKDAPESTLAYHPCSRDLVGLVLAGAERHASVRDLRLLVSYPVVTEHGKIASAGWNDGGIYYDEPQDLVGLQPNADRAREIFEDLLVDFPFKNPADFENYIGLLLTPILRPLIVGNVPMHMILSSLPRTGKTKLAEEVLGGILCGRSIEARQLVGDEAEIEKRILAILLRCETIVHLDNLRDYLDSPALASLLTAETFGGRVLGKTQDISVANLLTIVGTGNNVRFSGELAKRIVPICLQPATESPETRADFRHPDLRAHVAQCRRPVLEAGLGMAARWIAAGRPPGGVTLGGFEGWARTVGGVLKLHGFTEWGASWRAWQRQADPESEDMHALVEAWWAEHQGGMVTVRQVLDLAKRGGWFLSALARCRTEAAELATFSRVVIVRSIDRPVGNVIIRKNIQGHSCFYYLER